MGRPDFFKRSLSIIEHGASQAEHRGRLVLCLACSLLLFLICFPMSGIANAASITSAGHISGQILDGSRNNAPVTNQSVTLQMAQDNNSRDLLTITTDAQGRYAFSALESDASVQYAVYTLYQGAQYVTDLVDLSKKPNQQVNLTVYDATTSTTNIAVVQASILINKPNPQSSMLSVSEDFFFENLGTTTYVGAVDTSHGKPDALSFSLPLGARFLSLGTGFNGYTGTQVDTGFASNAAITPGTSEFSFSFQVPYSGNSYHFTYKALYPTVALSLLTPTNILTTPEGLTSKGPTNTQSGTFQMFQAQTLSANNNIGVQLAGLPVPAQAAPRQTSFNPGLLWLVVLLIALIILVGIAGYIYNARRRPAARAKGKQATRQGTTPEPGKKAAVSETKENLLREMLELDKDYEAGKLKKSIYQDQRAQLRDRLRPLMNEGTEKRAKAMGKSTTSSGKGEK